MLREFEQETLEKGIRQGIQRGKQEGLQEGLTEVAKKVLRKGESISDVVEITGFPEAEVDAIKKQLGC